MKGALEGVRVADFTHNLNGPYCTMLLAHLGAEVIKIEPPKGDAFRRSWTNGATWDGYEFVAVNTDKKSIVIDLKTLEGLELAHKIIAVSDVLVENYAPGTMEKFGLDYESVKSINTRLIYACSRGFGDSGPYAPYGSNAGVNNAMAGWTHTAWERSGKPGSDVMGIGDQAGGVSMTVGVLAALYEREQSGQGQRIEVAMQEALLGFMQSTFHEHFSGRKQREGRHPVEVADGYYMYRVPPLDDQAWGKLARLIGREDLVDDERFATPESRAAHRRDIDAMIHDWAQPRTKQEIWDGLRDIAYFGAPVLSVGDVIENEHIKARGVYVDMDHPQGGSLKLQTPWIRMSRTPARVEHMSPQLGEHTRAILEGLCGLTDSEIAALYDRGIIR